MVDDVKNLLFHNLVCVKIKKRRFLIGFVTLKTIILYKFKREANCQIWQFVPLFLLYSRLKLGAIQSIAIYS